MNGYRLTKKRITGFVIIIAVVLIGMFVLNRFNVQAKLTPQEAQEIVLAQYDGEITDIDLTDGIFTITLKKATGLYELKVPKTGGGIFEIRLIETSEIGNEIASNEEGASENQEKADENMIVPGEKTDATNEKNDASGEKDHASNDKNGASGKNKVDGSDAVNKDATNDHNADGVRSEDKNRDVKQDSGTTSPNVPTKEHSSGDSAKEQPSNNKQPSTSKQPPTRTLISDNEAIRIAQSKIIGEVEDVELKQSGNTKYYLIEIETENDQEAIVQVHAASGEIMSVTWHFDDDDDDDDDHEDDDEDDDDDNDNDDD